MRPSHTDTSPVRLTWLESNTKNLRKKLGEQARRGVTLSLVAGLQIGLSAANNPPPAAPASTTAEVLRTYTPPPVPSSADGIPALPPEPHVFATGAGQYEINSYDFDAAGAGLAMAEEVWQTLARPLDLPTAGFPTAINVWLLPATQWEEEKPFLAESELGGRVNVRVRWTPDAVGAATLRRALVQALLMRRAIAWHGLQPGLKVPLWLEEGCIGWSITHGRPAELDAWQLDSSHSAPPPLNEVLGLKRDSPVMRADELGSLWLMAHLQAESGPEQRWPALLQTMLGGEEPLPALARLYGNYSNSEQSRELWWQVGWQAERRQTATAVNPAAESLTWLVDRERWVARRGEADVMLSLDEVFAARKEPWVAAELAQRIGQIHGELGSNVLHPFYRNAAESLGRVYTTALSGNSKAFATALADLNQDITDGRELEKDTDAALDQWDARTAAQKAVAKKAP